MGDTTTIIDRADTDAIEWRLTMALKNTARTAIETGYLLKKLKERKQYESWGDYIQEKFRLSESTASRFMALNTKYSVSGNSMELSYQYRDISTGVLIEMLNIPQELAEQVTPDMTVRQVREIKKRAREPEPAPERTAGECAAENMEPASNNGTRAKAINGPIALREIPLATSQEMDSSIKSAHGLDRYDGILQTKGCGTYACFHCGRECDIRQEERYCVFAPLGNPYGCTTMNALEIIRKEVGSQCQFIDLDKAFHACGNNEPVPCCKECKDRCGCCCSKAKNLRPSDEEEAHSKEQRRLQDEYMYPFALWLLCKHWDWFREDYQNRGYHVDRIEMELKKYLGTYESGKVVYGINTAEGDKAYVRLFSDHIEISLWNHPVSVMKVIGKSEWFYLAAAIQSKWNEAASQMMQEQEKPAEEGYTPQYFLEEQKRELEELLSVQGVPKKIVERQKAIVAALTAMVYDLEPAEPIQVEQPEFPVLKNMEEREAFVKAYREWPVWCENRLTEETFYRYSLPDGSAIVVREYPYIPYEGWKDGSQTGNTYYLLKQDTKHFKDGETCMTGLKEHLRKVQQSTTKKEEG